MLVDSCFKGRPRRFVVVNIVVPNQGSTITEENIAVSQSRSLILLLSNYPGRHWSLGVLISPGKISLWWAAQLFSLPDISVVLCISSLAVSAVPHCRSVYSHPTTPAFRVVQNVPNCPQLFHSAHVLIQVYLLSNTSCLCWCQNVCAEYQLSCWGNSSFDLFFLIFKVLNPSRPNWNWCWAFH